MQLLSCVLEFLSVSMFTAVWSESDQLYSGPLATAEYVLLSLIIVQSNILPIPHVYEDCTPLPYECIL
jgi:hypothetical protein